MSHPLWRRWGVPLAVLALGISLAAAQEMSDDRATVMAAWEKLGATFEDNPDARVPVGDLPGSLAARLDLDHDGFVTRDEMKRMRRESRKPHDRSDFTLLKPDGFPLNVDPEIVSADEAGLGDDDMILGVVVNGEARAYPVNYMNGPHNEVVNDTLGDQPIAPSW
jgi:Protein of unknown function (DUF3179)